MVQLKKKSFLRSSEPALASYDWVDVASGEGYVLFDGFIDSSGSYHLSANAVYTKDVNSTTGSLKNSSEEIGTFETSEFNRPAILKGKVYIIFSFDVADGAGSGNTEGLIQAQFYHNTTSLFTLDSQTVSGSGGLDPVTAVITSDVSSRTLAVGDKLKVKLTGKETGNTRACTITLAHDPAGVSQTAVDTSVEGCSTTRLIVAVPFKLDI